MDEFQFNVPNLKDYEQHLLQMGTKVARSIGRKAARQGANVILREARLLARAGHPDYPNRITGRMARSLRVKDEGIRGDSIVFTINVTKYAFYARFVEFGTSHSKAYPFMRPAAENKARQAVGVMADLIGVNIEARWGRVKWA